MHIEDKYLVAPGVGNVDEPRRGIDGNSGGAFEETLAALEASDDALELAIGREYEDDSDLGVGNVDIVLLVDGDALGSAHGRSAIGMRQEFVFLLGEIEDVDAISAGIGDDDAAAGILRDTVGAHEAAVLRFAQSGVFQFGPEAALGFDFAFGAEAAFEGETAAAIHEEFGRIRGRRSLGNGTGGSQPDQGH